MKSNYEYNHGIMQQGAIVKLSIYRKNLVDPKISTLSTVILNILQYVQWILQYLYSSAIYEYCNTAMKLYENTCYLTKKIFWNECHECKLNSVVYYGLL